VINALVISNRDTCRRVGNSEIGSLGSYLTLIAIALIDLLCCDFRPVGRAGAVATGGRKKCRYFVGFCSTTRKLRILSGLVE
jgi:hypothetical protein